MKRDIAKISAVLKPMKSNQYVVTFWQKSEQVFIWAVKGLKMFSIRGKFLWSKKLSLSSTFVRESEAIFENALTCLSHSQFYWSDSVTLFFYHFEVMMTPTVQFSYSFWANFFPFFTSQLKVFKDYITFPRFLPLFLRVQLVRLMLCLVLCGI